MYFYWIKQSEEFLKIKPILRIIKHPNHSIKMLSNSIQKEILGEAWK